MKRRNFLALALGVPLAGCGGGWQLGFGPIFGGGGSGGTIRTTGRVVLPEGSPLTLGTVQLDYGFRQARPGGDGRVELEHFDTAPALLSLTDNEHRPALLSLTDEVSVLQTAVALVFYALGAFTLPTDAQAALLGLLQADSRVQALASQLTTLFKTKPYALADADPELIAAVVAVRDTILSGTGRAHPAATRRRDETPGATLILTSPENEQHGYFVGPNGEGLGLTITNTRRRNAFASIFLEAYTDAAGVRHTLAEPLFVRHQLLNQQLLWGTSGLASVLGSLVDVANGTVAYGPTTSGPYNLDVFPADAAKSEYRIHLVSNGNGGDSSGILAEDPTLSDQHIKICFITFVKDLLLPAAATLFGFQGALKDLWKDAAIPGTTLLTAFDDLAVLLSGVVDSGVAISAGSVRSLLVGVLKALVNNATLRQKFIEWIVRLLANQKFSLEVALSTLESRIPQLASRFNLILILVDKLMGAADLGAVIADWLRSGSYLKVTAKVIPGKVSVSPVSATVSAGDTLSLKARTTVDAPLLTWRWRIISGSGTLKNPASGLTGTSLDSASPELIYQSASTLTAKETVVVEVEGFVGSVNDPNRKGIGKATSTLTVHPSVITLTPKSATLAPGDSLGLSASVSGSPKGSLRYLWSLSGGLSGVALTDSQGHGGNSFESDQSAVQLQTSSASGGTVSVGVQVVLISETGERTSLGTTTATITVSDEVPFGMVQVKFNGKTYLLPRDDVTKLSGTSGLALGATYQRFNTEGLHALKLIPEFATPTLVVGSTAPITDSYSLTLELPGSGDSQYFVPASRANLVVTAVGSGYFAYTLSITLKGLRGVTTSGPAVLKGWVTGY